MNEHIKQLVAQIGALEEELSDALHDQEDQALFKIQGKRVEFEQSIKQAHRDLKQGFAQWLGHRPQNLITGPIIYGMALPLLILDLLISIYQFTCFPIYGIHKVQRRDYFIYDRRHLEYLNFIEKFHCAYCSYANGLIAYFSEILARTEQYFCPIKHARKMLGTHARYRSFLEYGAAEKYETKLEEFRNALGREK